MEVKISIDNNGNHFLININKISQRSKCVSYQGISKMKIGDTWYLGFTDYYTGNGEMTLNTKDNLDMIMEMI
jgi:hypothetical protein